MTITLYIDVKIDLFIKINLTIGQPSTRKNMIWRRHFISQGPFLGSLKHEKNLKGSSLQIHFIQNHLHIDILNFGGLCLWNWQHEREGFPLVFVPKYTPFALIFTWIKYHFTWRVGTK